MFVDCIRKQTNQCAQYKLKNCLRNMTAETLSQACFFFLKIKFLGSHAVALVEILQFLYHLLL